MNFNPSFCKTFYPSVTDMIWPKDYGNTPIPTLQETASEEISLTPYLFHGMALASLSLLNVLTSKKIEAYIKATYLFLLLPPTTSYFLSLAPIKKIEDLFENFKQTRMRTPLVILFKNQMDQLYVKVQGVLLKKLIHVEKKILKTKEFLGFFYDNICVKRIEQSLLLNTQNAVNARKDLFINHASPLLADLIIQRITSILKTSIQFFLLDQTIANAMHLHKALSAATLILSGVPSKNLKALCIKIIGAAVLFKTGSRKFCYVSILTMESFIFLRNRRLEQIGRNDPFLEFIYGKNYFKKITPLRPQAKLPASKPQAPSMAQQVLPALQKAVEVTAGVAAVSLLAQQFMMEREKRSVKYFELKANFVKAKTNFENAKQLVDEYLAKKDEADFDKIYLESLLKTQNLMAKELIRAKLLLVQFQGENKKASL